MSITIQVVGMVSELLPNLDGWLEFGLVSLVTDVGGVFRISCICTGCLDMG